LFGAGATRSAVLSYTQGPQRVSLGGLDGFSTQSSLLFSFQDLKPLPLGGADGYYLEKALKRPPFGGPRALPLCREVYPMRPSRFSS